MHTTRTYARYTYVCAIRVLANRARKQAMPDRPKNTHLTVVARCEPRVSKRCRIFHSFLHSASDLANRRRLLQLRTKLAIEECAADRHQFAVGRVKTGENQRFSIG